MKGRDVTVLKGNITICPKVSYTILLRHSQKTFYPYTYQGSSTLTILLLNYERISELLLCDVLNDGLCKLCK